MWKCKHCNDQFDFDRNTEKANHSRHCSENPAKQASYAKGKEASVERFNKALGALTVFNVTCACCSKKFQVTEREYQFPSKEAYFCSRSCANSTGGKAKAVKHHGDDVANYRVVGLRHHEKKCVVCGEERIVAVHHINENHHDNTPSNLVVLCPTHHGYVHSRYRHMVQPFIDEYVKNYRGRRITDITVALQASNEGSIPSDSTRTNR